MYLHLDLTNRSMIRLARARIGWVAAQIAITDDRSQLTPCVAMITVARDPTGMQRLLHMAKIGEFFIGINTVYPYAPWAVHPVDMADDEGESCGDTEMRVILTEVEVLGDPAAMFARHDILEA